MYEYDEEKPKLFSESGLKMIIEVYEQILASPNGLITVWEAIKGSGCDSFQMLACVDFLEEMGKIKVANVGGMTQDDIIILQNQSLTSKVIE